MSDIKAYFNSIPPFTRYFTVTAFTMSLLMTYKMLNPYHMVLVYDKVFYSAQIWRLFSTFLFAGTFGPSFLFTMIMMYFTLRRIEDHFKNKAAEFMTCILFCALCIMAYSAIYGNSMVLHKSFIFAMCYVICKLDPETMVSIWGFPVRSAMLPWVLLGLNVLQGADPIGDLIGIAAGHTYIYIKMVLP